MQKIALTKRQREVAFFLVQGLQNKQIAHEMRLSEATVKLHISGLLARLGVTNRTSAVIKVIRENMIDVDGFTAKERW